MVRLQVHRRIYTIGFNPLAVERTLALIKPGTADTDEQRCRYAQGFTIIQRKNMQLNSEQAGQFYREHKGKSFYSRLTNYMSSGPHCFNIV